MIYQNKTTAPQGQKHKFVDDAQAILMSICLVSFGVFLYKQAGLLTGGTAGLALLITRYTHYSFGQIFFALNLPFYYLALKRMGGLFTIKTFLSILGVSVLSDHMGYFITVQNLNTWFAGIFGGFLIGLGMLMLFRHQSSLGGINILVSYLQERYGISAGKLQMAIDIAILFASFFIINLWLLAASVVGAVAINIVLAINHKPGRYVGVS